MYQLFKNILCEDTVAHIQGHLDMHGFIMHIFFDLG